MEIVNNKSGQFMTDSRAEVCTATELFSKLGDIVAKFLKGKDMSGADHDEYFEFWIMGPDEKRWHEYNPYIRVSGKFMEFVNESKKNGLEFAGATKLAEELVTNPSTKLYFPTGSKRQSGMKFNKTL